MVRIPPAPAVFLAAIVTLALMSCARPAGARVDFYGKPFVDSLGVEGSGTISRTPIRPDAVPEINGPGRVTTVGNLWMKVTNIGVMGNPFPANGSDPCAQWPGPSGVEHLFFFSLWVGAKNPSALDPAAARRVSNGTEWRPPSLNPEDRIYQSYDGQVNGIRDFNDDGDKDPQGRELVDEEFLNGKDDDGDGRIDEDYAAISQQMFTCEMRDDTDQAVNANSAEKHVPLGVLIRQSSYAFAVPGANDFSAASYDVFNVSNHELDSLFVGFYVDQDCGPTTLQRYFADDVPEPRVPQGDYVEHLDPTQAPYDAQLCPQDTIHVRGFSLTDDDGDQGRTRSASTFLLLGCTTDPTGVVAPRRVGFRMYRFYIPGTPFVQGGLPTVDIERYQALSFGGASATVPLGIDPTTGLITDDRPDEASKNDYFAICSVGPYMHLQPGAKVSVQVAVAAALCDYSKPPNDATGGPNAARYQAVVTNAIEAQRTYRGRYVLPPAGTPTPDAQGRETGLIAAPGMQFDRADCRDEDQGVSRTVTDRDFTWFDFDCNYCTGVPGLVLKHWLAAAPPPSPALRLTPGDRKVTIAWDNLSEVTPDPASGLLDFYGYRIWKASNFTRPVGSAGPSDDLWALLAEFKGFDALRPLRDSLDTDGDGTPDTQRLVYPMLVNTQTGDTLAPIDIPPCKVGTTSQSGTCPPASTAPGDTAYFVGRREYQPAVGPLQIAEGYKLAIYPVGRYQYVDRNVLDGFVYFYSVTGKDSTGQHDVLGGRGTMAEQEGRRSAVESGGVVPQAPTQAAAGGKAVFVVPNPYRGRAQWDLTPDAADPTGTHIDFFNMPAGVWTLRIFTISGDLVQTIRSDDVQTNGKPQKESDADGQATWNLISRNGQDIVSGIYLFSVESRAGVQRGKFVVVR